MSIRGDAMIIAGGVALVVIGAWYLKSVASDAVDSVKEGAGQVVDWTTAKIEAAAPYVNPNDTKNIAYGGVNGLGAALSGNDKFDLGTTVYDWFH